MENSQLLVVGAGPYALATAALARERGIETAVVGRPMGFWREHMPAGMFLRSGAEWHLDADGVHSLEAYLREEEIAAADVDPIPIGLFLSYADWFRRQKRVEVEDDLVVELTKLDGRFEATLSSGRRIAADAVVCAPGILHFRNRPGWAAAVPPERIAHTCDLVDFRGLAGARVLIVGGRQSAYEWAVLIAEEGAERIEIVHRHEVPRFERVSWSFVDAYIEHTVQIPGWWRRLPEREREKVGRRFWEAGRLTLEYWLVPRLTPSVHSRPNVDVVEVRSSGSDGPLEVKLSDGARLHVDQIVLGTGYRADLPAIPYLAGVLEGIEVEEGYPRLGEALESSLPGLYFTGFAAARDFGPFFGFVRAAPAAAQLVIRDLVSHV
jgi:FAD-dependent urate hydroxylase